MLQAGDEMCRTQSGNNNTYCQDSEVSWLDWELDPSQGGPIIGVVLYTARILSERYDTSVP